MEKKQIFIEAIDILSFSQDEDNSTIMMVMDAFRVDADGIEEVFIDFPLHQDFYEMMKLYCSKYEEFMIKKFAEK